MIAATALFVAIAIVAIVAIAAHRARLGTRPPVMVGAFLLGWAVLVGGLAASGVTALDGGPPKLLVLPWILIAIAIVASRRHRTLVAAIPPAALIAIQVFRVPVELALWRLASAGRLAAELTFDGRNFDILVGLTAIPIALAARSRPRLRRAWNIAGLALLANIVVMAVLSTPGIHVLHFDPPTTVIGELANVWLPAFLVPVAAVGHVTALRRAAC